MCPHGLSQVPQQEAHLRTLALTGHKGAQGHPVLASASVGLMEEGASEQPL